MSDFSDTNTYNLLLLLASRARRREEWINRTRYARWPDTELDDSEDENMLIDLAEELAKRIDAGRAGQP